MNKIIFFDNTHYVERKYISRAGACLDIASTVNVADLVKVELVTMEYEYEGRLLKIFQNLKLFLQLLHRLRQTHKLAAITLLILSEAFAS